MPAPRINLRKLKDALRLKLEGGQSHQQIAASLEISKGVATKYVGLAVAAGLDWTAVQAQDEATLERRLLGAAQQTPTYARPDFGRIHQELRRKGVTLMLLWEEYCAQVSDEHTPEYPVRPWRYSQFCENYRQFAKRLKRSMRQIHRVGERLFIDFAGPTVPLTDGGRANIFVAAMGASGYCYCLADGARVVAGGAHVKLFEQVAFVLRARTKQHLAKALDRGLGVLQGSHHVHKGAQHPNQQLVLLGRQCRLGQRQYLVEFGLRCGDEFGGFMLSALSCATTAGESP